MAISDKLFMRSDTAIFKDSACDYVAMELRLIFFLQLDLAEILLCGIKTAVQNIISVLKVE